MASLILSHPVEIPKPTEEITQWHLKTVLQLRQQIEQLESELKRAEAEILVALRAGTGVEAGLLKPYGKAVERRCPAWREECSKLADTIFGLGKGEGYCAEVLGRTPATRHEYLQINLVA